VSYARGIDLCALNPQYVAQIERQRTGSIAQRACELPSVGVMLHTEVANLVYIGGVLSS